MSLLFFLGQSYRNLRSLPDSNFKLIVQETKRTLSRCLFKVILKHISEETADDVRLTQEEDHLQLLQMPEEV